MMRVKVTLIHFLWSLIIFLVVVILLVFFWYPVPNFNASGGWQGLKIAASVDLVLGPLLTFVIFNPKKSKSETHG